MLSEDLNFVIRAMRAGIVHGPVLELGAGSGGETCREAIVAGGLQYYGTDLNPGQGIDFVANFESVQDISAFQPAAPFGSILVLNVLEHTFDPIRILDNLVSLLKPGGTLIGITPPIWPIHNFPIDCWRPLPDFWLEYGKRRSLTLLDDWFEFIGAGPIRQFKHADGTIAFPPPCSDQLRRLYGRIVHRVFNTYARSMAFPSHLGIGVVFRAPS